jgi:tripeptidyl-peptidase-1
MLSIPATRTAIRVSQVPVALVQNLFAVSLHTVTHGSRQTATRCISRCEIRVPSHIHHLVQSIEGLVDIPIIKRGLTPNKQVSATDINVTPAQIFAQYDISKESSPNCNKTAQTVAEFSGSNWLQSYSPADLTNFQRTYGLKEQPIAKLYGKNEPTQPTGEATLDIQYIMAAAQGVPTWFWGETGSYLDYLIHVQNVVDGPLVHSISYSIGDELYVDGSHMQLLNSHFQIIALRGISLIWASGDEGTGNTGMFGCGTFSPGFPASSPYITSVGATSFTTSSLETPSNPRRANSENLFRTNKYGEHAASYSGGGFSTVFPRPSYQDKFVNNYFTQMKQSLPPAAYYNATGRGFPDVSAVGTNFLIFVGGISGPPMPVSGTSAATPLFSAMLTMINNELAARGKKSVGFANVALYRAPASIWNPITSGNNAYYPCDSGFTAAAPWAPISGLGSPNFPALLNYFLSL